MGRSPLGIEYPFHIVRHQHICQKGYPAVYGKSSVDDDDDHVDYGEQ